MLFLVGFSLIFAGVILLVVSSFISDNTASTGGIIIVGPIPIIIGSGRHGPFLILLAVVLTVFCLVLFFLMHRQVESTENNTAKNLHYSVFSSLPRSRRRKIITSAINAVTIRIYVNV